MTHDVQAAAARTRVVADPLDFYAVGSLLSDEEQQIRDAVCSFVDEQVLPIIDRHAEDGTFPGELVPALAELGVFGPTIAGYGCAGVSYVAYGLICQELERGDSALRSFASVQGSLVMYPIHAFGSQEQRDRWLPRLAAGRAIGCFGLTEPDHGSDPGGMETRARRDGDGYVLNGAKMWITNGTIADVAVVWARDDEDQVRGFLVERGTPGYSARDIKGKWSLRASVTSELALDDCRVPASALLPGATSLKAALSCLNEARYGIAWGALGAAAHCLDTALRYAGIRTQFGRPIAGFQLVQEKLVWMVEELTKGRLLALQLGRLKDQGRAGVAQVSLAKKNNVRMALQCARLAREILGANGIVSEYPVFRHMCNLESVDTYEGTHDIHALIVGQAITGLPAFRAG